MFKSTFEETWWSWWTSEARSMFLSCGSGSKFVGPLCFLKLISLLSKNDPFAYLDVFGVPHLRTHHVFDVFPIVSAQSNLCLQISNQEPTCAIAAAYRMPDGCHSSNYAVPKWCQSDAKSKDPSRSRLSQAVKYLQMPVQHCATWLDAWLLGTDLQHTFNSIKSSNRCFADIASTISFGSKVAQGRVCMSTMMGKSWHTALAFSCCE